MGDECNCEKCQAGSFYYLGAVAWPVGMPETTIDGRGNAARDFYLIIGEGGISLRQRSPDF
jgi:hypothetical protein